MMQGHWQIAKAVILGCAICVTTSSSGSLPAESESPPSGYDLVPSFSEEFDGARLDTKRWINVYADPSPSEASIAKRNLWGNGELQVYFDAAYLGLGVEPFRLADGILTIQADRLSTRALSRLSGDLARQPPQIRDSALRNVQYSSGLISTKGRFQQRYGYFEIRARWSNGKGLWPAFWLLPADGSWPPEIDVLEAHGDKPGTAYQSIHSKIVAATTRTASYQSGAQSFHRYGALWTPTRVDYFIDGVKTSSIDAPADLSGPMYMIANLAIGGTWPGNPTSDVKFPATMDIDYIRVWRFNRLPPAAATR